MRPSAWHPPVELLCAEQTIITCIKRAKLFVFLRYHRHELFNDAFQEELATLYTPSLRGQPPIPPAQLAVMAHQAFNECQSEMQILATQIAVQHGWTIRDYRDVIHRLKQNQLPDEKILPFYQHRLKELEDIIVVHGLVTLPSRQARIRLGTPAESAAHPAPHMVPPPLLNNTGQEGEFVLPLNMPMFVDD